MGLALHLEKRRFKRFAISGRLPGVLMDSAGTPLTFIAVDVSVEGFGFILDTPLKVGDVLTLKIEVQENVFKNISLTVQWLQKRTAIQLDTLTPTTEVYACGTHHHEKSENLEQLLSSIPGVLLEDLS